MILSSKLWKILEDAKRILWSLDVYFHWITPDQYEGAMSFPNFVERNGNLISHKCWLSVVCMWSFSYEDSINVYRFIELVAYLLAQAVHIDRLA